MHNLSQHKMTPYHNNDTFRPILISTVLMHSFNERMMTMHKNRERNVSLFIKPIILTKREDRIINVWKNIIKCVQTITDEMRQEETDIAMGCATALIACRIMTRRKDRRDASPFASCLQGD